MLIVYWTMCPFHVAADFIALDPFHGLYFFNAFSSTGSNDSRLFLTKSAAGVLSAAAPSLTYLNQHNALGYFGQRR